MHCLVCYRAGVDRVAVGVCLGLAVLYVTGLFIVA